MEKTVTFFRKSTPENPEFGYGDTVSVVMADGKELYRGSASTCPNPYRLEGTKTIPWQRIYSLVAPGEFDFECVVHKKLGKSLLINQGQAVPTVNCNSNHRGQRVATEIFVHTGAQGSKNKDWRGSAGCFTVPKESKFFDHFIEGEGGRLILC